MAKKLKKNSFGITLISLVITIIVLLILAGITTYLTIGENGVINKSEGAVTEHTKQEAVEKINFKVTNTQIHTYAEKQKMPTLQEVANLLCNDNEIEYVNIKKRDLASNNKVDIGDAKSIFTKLTQYPYEFEINSSLQLASIDGVKLATSNGAGITDEELEKKIDEKLASSYQRLRSDDFEEVPFTNGGKYIAPCDGYYCFAYNNASGSEDQSVTYIIHYSKDDVFISGSASPSHWYGYSGGEIYMKKGESIYFHKENVTNIVSSKFFYAEGCTPDVT